MEKKSLDRATCCGMCHEKMEAGERFEWHQKGPIMGSKRTTGRPARWVPVHAYPCLTIKSEQPMLEEKIAGLRATVAMIEQMTGVPEENRRAALESMHAAIAKDQKRLTELLSYKQLERV